MTLLQHREDSKIDHLVLTTAHEADCIRFYKQSLGLRLEIFVGRTPPVEHNAFEFGAQKINPRTRRAASSNPRRTRRCRARWTCA